ncbi:hypothetical protein [Pseudomonas psychrophila]|uniref:hypothetical protein n=1 Tax=Pseudomonas psychrophila TaxID=122355 RepID=UPI0037F1E8C3
MDSTLDDGGDFKKARGFLLTYSAVLWALWFFGANLTTFKLMGTEILLGHRTNSVWLVLACLNIYFWFRFIQHMPSGSFRFDQAMNDQYDKSLKRAAVWVKHFELKKAVQLHHDEHQPTTEKTKLIRGSANLTYPQRLETDRRHHPEEEFELHQYNRKARTEMSITGYCKRSKNGEWELFGTHIYLPNYTPSRLFTWTVKAYAMLTGAFITPWFTNLIAPLMLGAVSTVLAIWNWWQINHPAIVG